MNNLFKIVAAVVVAVALGRNAQAVPITGGITFSGTATLNSNNIAKAASVTSWGTNKVTAISGTFLSFGSISLGDVVKLAPNWSFDSGVLGKFWQVGGFTFNLADSSAFSLVSGVLTIILNGSVSGNNFDVTPFSGTVTIHGIPGTAGTTFSDNFSFNPVPDGGTTVLLLGAALSGVALVKRKLKA
jgi:hypothetical protein